MWLTSNTPTLRRTARCSSTSEEYWTGMSQPPKSTILARSVRWTAFRQVDFERGGGGHQTGNVARVAGGSRSQVWMGSGKPAGRHCARLSQTEIRFRTMLSCNPRVRRRDGPSCGAAIGHKGNEPLIAGCDPEAFLVQIMRCRAEELSFRLHRELVTDLPNQLTECVNLFRERRTPASPADRRPL